MLVTESTANLLATATTLLVFGGLIVHTCFPHRWQTWGVWMGISLRGIPALLLLAATVIAYPWLVAAFVPLVMWSGKKLRKPKGGGGRGVRFRLAPFYGVLNNHA